MKKIVIILTCLCTVLCGCAVMPFVKMKGDKQIKYIENLIKNKDEDGLFNLFSNTAIEEVGEAALRDEIRELFVFCDADDFALVKSGMSEGSKSNRGVSDVERRLSIVATINGEEYFFGVGMIRKSSSSEDNEGISEIHLQLNSDLNENGRKMDYFQISGITIFY